MARAALSDVLWIYWILAYALFRIHPLKFPSLTPVLPPFLAPLNPSSARFLPPAVHVHASSRPFLARSLHQPSLPHPSLPPLTLSVCLASSLPTSLPLLSPSLSPFLIPSLPPSSYAVPPSSTLPCSLPPSHLPLPQALVVSESPMFNEKRVEFSAAMW